MKSKNSKEEKKMIKFLTKNCREIISINNSQTRSMLDTYKYGRSYFFELDWKDNILAYYNFFISMIGFTEAFIIDNVNKIQNEKDDNKLKKLIENKEFLIEKRDKDRKSVV